MNEKKNSGPTIFWIELVNKKVKTVDGKTIGKIKKVSEHNIRVDQGSLKKKKLWIPKFVAEAFDGDNLWLSIAYDDIHRRYYRDEEPSNTQYEEDKLTFKNTYGKDPDIEYNDKVNVISKRQKNIRNEYKNIRDLK